MAKASLQFRADSADHLTRKFLKITILRFDIEMGKRLVEVRKNIGVTQRQLADQLGLSQTDVSRLEQGKKVNALPTSDVFKTVLGRNFDYVCFGGWLMDQTELSIEKDKRLGKWWAKLR